MFFFTDGFRILYAVKILIGRMHLWLWGLDVPEQVVQLYTMKALDFWDKLGMI
jgi:hypothetical protein